MKKLNTKGFSIVEMAIVVVVIGLAVGIGLFAKNRISGTNGDAQAVGYTTVNDAGGVIVGACRISNSNPKRARVVAWLSGGKYRQVVTVALNNSNAVSFTPNRYGITRTITAAGSSSNPSLRTNVRYSNTPNGAIISTADKYTSWNQFNMC